jgi:4'-phosphopantetheinyl transferase
MPPSLPSDASRPTRAAQLRAVFDAAWRRADGRDAGESALARSASQGSLAVFFDLDAWRPWLDDARLLLDDAEHARVQRKQRARDREELALGYGLHRLVLARLLQRDPAQVALGRDTLGRPCLPDDELHTSLSHADGAVAVAVGHGGCVGIDLERATRAAELPGIAERVWHPDEAPALASLPETQRAAALLALWVRKEALLKAAGIGLAREMDSFRAPAGEVLALPATGATDGADAIVYMLEVGPDWVAAIAGPPASTPFAAWLHPQTG